MIVNDNSIKIQKEKHIINPNKKDKDKK